MSHEDVILKGVPPTKIIGTGRRKGDGCNLRLLARLTPGEVQSCVWDVPFDRMNSIITSGKQHGIKCRVRKLEDKPKKEALYGIWRVN